jgi:predicted RNA-binding Zn-ribbon protein involved in translation (DUF1610 family)
MSFEEFDDAFVWRCDECKQSAIFPPGDFWRALAELKSRGWRIDRGQDGWGHYCPRCKKSGAEILSMPVVAKARG